MTTASFGTMYDSLELALLLAGLALRCAPSLFDMRSPTGVGGPSLLLDLPVHVLDLHGAGLGLGHQVGRPSNAGLLLANHLAGQDVVCRPASPQTGAGECAGRGPGAPGHLTLRLLLKLLTTSKIVSSSLAKPQE